MEFEFGSDNEFVVRFTTENQTQRKQVKGGLSFLLASEYSIKSDELGDVLRTHMLGANHRTIAFLEMCRDTKLGPGEVYSLGRDEIDPSYL